LRPACLHETSDIAKSFCHHPNMHTVEKSLLQPGTQSVGSGKCNEYADCDQLCLMTCSCE
jgi:hypothetical protein